MISITIIQFNLEYCLYKKFNNILYTTVLVTAVVHMQNTSIMPALVVILPILSGAVYVIFINSTLTLWLYYQDYYLL